MYFSPGPLVIADGDQAPFMFFLLYHDIYSYTGAWIHLVQGDQEQALRLWLGCSLVSSGQEKARVITRERVPVLWDCNPVRREHRTSPGLGRPLIPSGPVLGF